jgi:hypothetical protein
MPGQPGPPAHTAVQGRSRPCSAGIVRLAQSVVAAAAPGAARAEASTSIELTIVRERL